MEEVPLVRVVMTSDIEEGASRVLSSRLQVDFSVFIELSNWYVFKTLLFHSYLNSIISGAQGNSQSGSMIQV